ncbi:hypothetical protein [Aeromonas media]|uniref:hypothetical protein n=1 Tax=Aeromonas media TaxID=651 RepID=UPI003D25F56A
MGLFDFLKLSRKNKEPVVKTDIKNRMEPSNSMPTVEPDKEIYKCYDEVFKIMFADISGITEKEANEIHAIIKNCEGGFLNMSGYHSIVWDKYFKGRCWQWNEYEEWNDKFTRLGRFPSRFPKKKVATPITVRDALNLLTVGQLKILCDECNLSFQKKIKKMDLVELLESTTDIASSSLVVSEIDKLNNRFMSDLYSLFMRTINFRGHDLHNVRKSKSLGIKFGVLHTFEEDKEFVEMVLKNKPNALHPLFPGDMSSRKSILPF